MPDLRIGWVHSLYLQLLPAVNNRPKCEDSAVTWGRGEREGFLLYLILVMHFVNLSLTSRFLKIAVEKMENTAK